MLGSKLALGLPGSISRGLLLGCRPCFRVRLAPGMRMERLHPGLALAVPSRWSCPGVLRCGLADTRSWAAVAGGCMLLLRGARQGSAPLCSRWPHLAATARLPPMSRARSNSCASLPGGRLLLLGRGVSTSLHSRDAAPVGVGWLLVVEGGSDIRSFDGRYFQLAALGTRLQLLLCQRGPGRSSPVAVGSSWGYLLTCSSCRNTG